MTPAKNSSYVIGIDVGGTNTDAVILQGHDVVAWHKTSTTPDIQAGVESAIKAVLQKSNIASASVSSVKIGTTASDNYGDDDLQFVNAVLEQDSSKLDKVAVIRLCGPYSRGSPPFVDFPTKLRTLMKGHYGYVDGGFQVDGAKIMDLDVDQLKEQAAVIKLKCITSVVVIGVYSPAKPEQELRACDMLAAELGPEYDISCSHAVGRLGYLERENASILNASLRRFARHVVSGFSHAVQELGCGNLYITLNDGTLSKAAAAAEFPVRCFSSGPTNSARGAALLAKSEKLPQSFDQEILVVDVGGTTTDICSLLKSGYPRQSAAFVKIAGVRTNFTIPDVVSIPLGGGSRVRVSRTESRHVHTSVGPDSVGSQIELEACSFGGQTLTATDLALANHQTPFGIAEDVKVAGLETIKRTLEQGIDLVKTKQGDVLVILVGGGSIIVGDEIAGVSKVIRPKYFEVANAIGAAIGKISGTVDTTVVPSEKTIDELIEEAKTLAMQRCIAAGGDQRSIEIVEIEVVPISYTTNGATRVVIRVVGDLVQTSTGFQDSRLLSPSGDICQNSFTHDETGTKGSLHQTAEPVDLLTYRPRIEGGLWYLSETDLQFLVDGTGVLGVGSCGEPYPTYLACLVALRSGCDIRIQEQKDVSDDAVILGAGFMACERIPGLNEVVDSMKCVMTAVGLESFDCVIPNEIGGMNAFEALLAGSRLGKSTLDTDCVARAYPMVWQTIRCLRGASVTPSAVADGCGEQQLFMTAKDNFEAEEYMREACTRQGSLAGMCVSPMSGAEAKMLPQNSYSYAWNIGRTIALARFLKKDIVSSLLESESGVLLFSGKIIAVKRHVAQGFTRGSVLLEQTSVEGGLPPNSLSVEFENENLVAIEKSNGKKDRVLACCPDLITFLDMANGAPLGISDYKYGLRVNVIALPAPPVWTTPEGLKMGGPQAFDLNDEYQGVCSGAYKAPKSVFEMFRNTPDRQ
ncbi:hypothetical protein BP5796_03137 [Coleophoma crateriformis]|uniref:Uncharacterized protein n=1 Tax=Coleophoma crateriformis TaxID=565419 RepID=A0A3D8SM93_9HELO|nr:hypothetical protein BP5796_03137 [Coleophoma crateriformis]